MSELARIRAMLHSGVGTMNGPVQTNVAPVIMATTTQAANAASRPQQAAPMLPGSDSEEELNIWEPAGTQAQTLASLSYFTDENYNQLKKKEKKKSMENFFIYLDQELGSIVRAEQAALDALF